jgi:hypothetical protein
MQATSILLCGALLPLTIAAVPFSRLGSPKRALRTLPQPTADIIIPQMAIEFNTNGLLTQNLGY